MTSFIPSDSFRVGRILASPSQNMLFHLPEEGERNVSAQNASVRIEPRAMEVLEVLARAEGEVVSRDDIMESVWPDTMVTDDALNRAISSLRKTLQGRFEESDVIETIPKRGYRLTVMVDLNAGRAFRGDIMPDTPPQARVSQISLAQHSPTIPDTSGSVATNLSSLLHWKSVLGLFGGVILLVLVWSFAIQEPEETIRFPRAVTFDDRVERMPAISPDESRVAFSREDSLGLSRIVVRLLDGESELEITDGGYDMHPSWSSDGSRIAFVRWDDGCSLQAVPSLGGTARKVASCNGIYPDVQWGPNDQLLVFNSREGESGPFAIHILELETGAMRMITNPPETAWGDHDPHITPDGQRLTFTRSFSEGMQDQFVVDLESGIESRLTNDGRLIRGSSLAPGGNSVIIASNRGGSSGLWEVPLAGGTSRPVAVADNRIQFVDIGPEGRTVYQRAREEVRLHLLTPNDGMSRDSWSAVGTWNMHPAVQPHGTGLAWISNLSGNYEVWWADSTGAEPERLTAFGGGFTSRPAWSPDGSSLVLVSRVRGNPDLYIVEEGALPRRLTQSQASELAPSFSADGRYVYFTTEVDGQWMARRYELASGQIDMSVPFAMGVREISDGSGIYYARTDQNGLFFRLDLNGEERLIADDLSHTDWGHFDLMGRDVIYYARSDQAIKKWNAATGEVETLVSDIVGVPSWDPALAVMEDGSIIIAQQGNMTSDLFVIEDVK